MNIQQRPARIGNYSRGRQLGIDTITFHHIVGDANAALHRFQSTADGISSTYVIGSNGQVYQCVAEGDTPHTNGNWNSNSRSITIEHAGGHHAVPYTEAMYHASIELVRSIRSRHNITQVKRHRDIVGTACPGGLDVERIWRESTPHKPTPQTNQGGQDVANRDQVNNIYRAVLHRDGDAGGLNNYQNKDANSIIGDMLISREWQEQNHILKVAFPETQRLVGQHQATINELNRQVQSLKSNDEQDAQTIRETAIKVNSLTEQLKATQAQLARLQNTPPAMPPETKNDPLAKVTTPAKTADPKTTLTAKIIVAMLKIFSKKR